MIGRSSPKITYNGDCPDPATHDHDEGHAAAKRTSGLLVATGGTLHMAKPPHMFGELDPDQIELLLQHLIVGRIGCHADGVTYIVPISYAYDGESVFMHTFEGMKINIMRKNPQVCFQVEEMASMANWKSVVAWGTFEEITDLQEQNRALNLLTHRVFPIRVSKTVHLTSSWPFESEKDLPVVDGIVCRIRLTKKTGRFENDLLHPRSTY